MFLRPVYKGPWSPIWCICNTWLVRALDVIGASLRTRLKMWQRRCSMGRVNPRGFAISFLVGRPFVLCSSSLHGRVRSCTRSRLMCNGSICPFRKSLSGTSLCRQIIAQTSLEIYSSSEVAYFNLHCSNGRENFATLDRLKDTSARARRSERNLWRTTKSTRCMAPPHLGVQLAGSKHRTQHLHRGPASHLEWIDRSCSRPVSRLWNGLLPAPSCGCSILMQCLCGMAGNNTKVSHK